jgi:hypothetical protein
MKNLISGVSLVLMVGVLVSCATTSSGSSGSGGLYKPLGASEIVSFDIIGSVQIEIPKANTSKWDGSVTQANKEDAYIRLLAEAKRQYQRNDIDVRNISVVSRSPLLAVADLSATGDVVVRNSSASASGVEGALARAADDTLRNVPARSRIAIVYITAEDKSSTDYIAGELEFIWVKAGFIIIDRSQLDRIRREQNYQYSGEVDDDTAVSLGKIIGADVIVTGRVDGEGNLRRLRLRALNTQTAQVVGVASERL